MIFWSLLSFKPNEWKNSWWQKFELILIFGSLDNFVSQEYVSFAELSNVKLFVVFINLWSLRRLFVILIFNDEDFFSFNRFWVDKLVSDSIVSFFAQVVPLLVQKNWGFLNCNSNSVVVSFLLWINYKIKPYCSA